jgi:polyisoprenyl-phosphate glycosyltransferase
MEVMYCVITPVYRNAEFVPQLISELSRIDEIVQRRFGIQAEFIFVADRSPGSLRHDTHR